MGEDHPNSATYGHCRNSCGRHGFLDFISVCNSSIRGFQDQSDFIKIGRAVDYPSIILEYGRVDDI